jgi:PAS domain S-box-containing protein
VSKKTRRILLVDDNPDDLVEMRRMLLIGSEDHFTFTQAGLGKSVIEIMRDATNGMPDCLLLDYHLPDMDAPEVLAALQGTDGMTLCPVVVLTGAEGAELGKLVLRAGAQDFIGKGSLTPIALVRAVENATERWTMVRELMNRERALAARERELYSLADNTPDILSRFDHNLRHVFVNKAVERMTGQPPAYFIGLSWRDLCIPVELCVLWEDALASVFRTGEPSAIEFAYDYNAQRSHYVTRLVPEFDDNGVVEFVLGVTHDITKRWEAEKALREEDRRKDEFLATLAHELRNPLAPLTTCLEILKLSPAGGPAASRAREVMERQLRHMVHLIDDLLDISRVSTGKVVLRRSQLTIQEIVGHAVEASQPLIDAASHRLDVHMPATPIWVDGDLTRLAQVVSHLLSNAVKYTPNAGRIVVSAHHESGQAVIRIADNGVGIPADMLPKIFDLFTQVNGTLKRAQGGLGIGLSLARSLLAMHDASVEGESAGLGQGSTFTVRLPMTIDAANDAANDATNDSARDATGSAPTAIGAGVTDCGIAADEEAPARRVFVIDDNVDAADMLVLMLELGGCVTMTAHDGEAGLLALDGFRADLAFIDIGLPGMTGYDVARQIRTDPQMAGTVLIALTGWGSEADKRRATDAGFDFHMTKPVELAAVEALLTRAMTS